MSSSSRKFEGGGLEEGLEEGLVEGWWLGPGWSVSVSAVSADMQKRAHVCS